MNAWTQGIVGKVNNLLREVAADRRSGSLTLQKKLETGLLSIFFEAPDPDPEELLELFHLFSHARSDYYGFPVVLHFLDRLLARFPEHHERASGQIYDILLAYRKAWQNVDERIFDHFLEQFPVLPEAPRPEEEVHAFLWPGAGIMVHSQSGTVISFLRMLKEKARLHDLRLYQTESRPLLEGREQARHLTKMGYQVTFLPDAAISVVMRECDLVILGADTLGDTYFVNKTGSYPIALMAAEAGVPLVVLADSRKAYEPENTGKEDRHNVIVAQGDPGEVWEDPPRGIEVVNIFLEPVPNDLASFIVTEEDVYPGDGWPHAVYRRKKT